MRYFFIAGEASGDLHASHLIRSLRANDAEAEFRGFGGDLMQAEGMQLLRHYSDLAYMGFVQVVLHLRTILRALRDCENAIESWQPHCVVLVDYPGFNLKIAEWVKSHTTCPIFYYIAPKIWAWKEGRIRSIRRNVDHLLSILPFEVDYFSRRHHYPVEYVGNPSHDEVSAFLSTYEETREAFCVRHGWDDQRELIAVLAGSRRAEIADNLPRMLEAVRRVADPARYRVVLAAAPGISDEEYARYGISLSAASAATSDDAGKTAAALTSSATSSGQLPICAVRGETFALLTHARAALVTSGTATLEVALCKRPMVISYKISPLTYAYVKRKIKVPHVGLPNILLGREAVPELLQSRAKPQLLADALIKWYESPEECAALQRDFHELHHMLRRDTAELAAQNVLEEAGAL